MSYADLINQGVKACSQNVDGELVATFCFAPENKIFDGHFPGNPILPGICQLEMVKYMIERIFACKCQLQQASSIKFFQPVLPEQEFTFVVSCKQQDGELLDIKCKGTVGQNNAKSTEIKARYKINGATQKK